MRSGGVRCGTCADAPVGATAGDRVSRHGGRPLPDLTTPDRGARRRRHPARHDRARSRPRRRPAPPRGPGQADRRRQVRRRPRLPGRLVRGHDPLDRRARPVRRARPRPGLRLVDGRRRHRGRHPGRQHRQLDQGRPADPRPGRWRDPAPRRAAGAPRRARPGDAPGGARTPSRSGPSRSRRSSIRSSRTTSFAAYELGQRRPGRGVRGRRPRPRGRVPGRPPGAAVHREQRDDRGARRATAASPSTARSSARTTSTRRSSAASPSTTARRGSSRPRPAAGSVARRSTRRSSRSTPRSWPARPAGRCG